MTPEEHIPHATWNETIALAKNGDDAAARWLVETLHGQVLRIVRNHLPRREDEQDLTQEVFMKVFASIDRFQGLQPFPHWVARIALNTCYDHLRKQKTRPELRFSDLSPAEQACLEQCRGQEETSSSGRFHETDAPGLVRRLLATLKPGERMIVQSLDLEGKSLRETCELTGWGLSRVKVTAMRARRKLAEKLQRLEKPGHP